MIPSPPPSSQRDRRRPGGSPRGGAAAAGGSAGSGSGAGGPHAATSTAPIGELTDLRQLRVFQALARTRSFTETAALMSVTQSAISHSVKGLENTLGFPLFDRSGRSLALTKEGETLLAYVSEALREIGRATQQLSILREGELNTLRFGSTDTVCQFLLPGVLAQVNREFPSADIALKVADTRELVAALRDGTIDLMLGIDDPLAKPVPGTQSVTWFSDTLHFVASSSHPRAAAGNCRLDPADLAGERLLLSGSGSITHRMARSWLDGIGAAACRVVAVRSIGAMKELARSGFGLGLVPAWVLLDSDRDLTAFELAPPSLPLDRAWKLSMRQTHSISDLERRFLTLLRTASNNAGSDPGGGSGPVPTA